MAVAAPGFPHLPFSATNGLSVTYDDGIIRVSIFPARAARVWSWVTLRRF